MVRWSTSPACWRCSVPPARCARLRVEQGCADLAAWTKSLAEAWASDGIRVNIVAPGWIDTPLMAAHVNDTERSAQVVGRTPLGLWGRPDDVVGPVLFLASDAAWFVTGALLTVDGGYSAN